MTPRPSRALLLLLLVAAAGCKLDPEGTCGTRADCPAGLDCLSGVCAACRDDGDCAEWQGCGLDGLCATLDGRCGDATECASWEACAPAHVCVARADHCPLLGCTGLLVCDPAHHCSLPGGSCLTDDDCMAWMASCDTALDACTFSATPGDDVLAVGTLVDGSCAHGAVARATTAGASAAIELGLGCGSAEDGRAWLDPVTGELVYRFAEATGGDTLRRLRRDELEWDAAAGLWRFPPAPAENDDVALAPGACESTWDGWIMHAGTGALLYACPVSGGTLRHFYDATDATVAGLDAVQEAYAWSEGGSLLVRSAAGVLQILDGSGIATAVAGLPDGELLARRTTATGFRVALRPDVGGPDELWEIDAATALATLAGPYASVSVSYPGVAWGALSSDGTLHGGTFVGTREVILARPLDPGVTAVAYAEGDQPAGSNDFAAETPFEPFLRLDRFLLVTRP